MSKYVERELTNPVLLCDPDGRLNPDAVGWSRKPLQRCNLAGSWPRKKKWNYWCVTTDKFLFSFTISNIDYIGMIFAYFFDFETKKFIEKTVMAPFGIGCDMPEEVERDVVYSGKQMPMEIIYEPDKIRVGFQCPDMNGAQVSADLVIHRPNGHETLNVVIPWNNKQFQFTSKQNTMPVEGTIDVGGKKYLLDLSKAWACLDFGRGIWPYQTSWNWGACSGKQGENVVGLNLGGKWTDGTGYNENGICFNGKLFKISEDLIWEYDVRDFMKPWRIITEHSETLDLYFEPFYERVAKTNLIALKSEAHQCFGYYGGALKFDGAVVKIDKIMGWAEEHMARW